MTMTDDRHEGKDASAEVARRRLRGLAVHLLGGALLAIVAVVVDVTRHGLPTWSAWLIVGWGGVLALHVAYAMGLFEGLLRHRS